MKKDFKDKKDSKVKKPPNISTNHNYSGGGQSSQLTQTLRQTLGQSAKKSSYLHQGKKSTQPFSIPAIEVNITMVKKDKKLGNKDLS